MLETNFLPFPELQTKRLLLRRMTMADAAALFSLRSNESAMQYIGRPKATSIEEMEAYIQRIEDNLQSGDGILWAIALQDDPALMIGTICYWKIVKENY